MTALAVHPAPVAAPPELPSAARWLETLTLSYGRERREMLLTNFAGPVYPVGQDAAMIALLGIVSHERVLEIEGGNTPFSRADESLRAFARGSECECATESDRLPFADDAFDFVYACDILARAVNPAVACRELMRVAKHGFLETRSPLAEYLGGDPLARWLVHVEQQPDGPPTLVFQRKPFRRAPFRYALRPLPLHDREFGFRWEWQFRNLSHTQFAWDGAFRFRVDEHPDGIDLDDPDQAVESLLDSAINGLRTGGLPPVALWPHLEQALALKPDLALTHNTRGCLLWLDNQIDAARAAFAQAALLDPTRAEYALNARLHPGAGQPRLVLLPPTHDEQAWIETNFAGKVYYAFVSFDARLAQDLAIVPGERVLDVGGGQRPLQRADVSVDFDVFEGLHRQGLQIARDRPLVCGDAQRLPFRDRAFDVACCRMVLEHIVDPAAACHELMRVAKRGFLETPNTFWECFYGHPTHRWFIEWEAATRTLVFRRKPLHEIPFRSAIVPFLYGNEAVQRAFEITFRNITTTQVTWDEQHPFHIRVEDDPDCPYDYLARPADAVRGSLSYAGDLLRHGLPHIALAEVEDALRFAKTWQERQDAWTLRLRVADAMNDAVCARQIRARLQTFEWEREREANGNTPAATIPDAADLPAVTWFAPLLDPSGYADEARNFLFALDGIGMDVTARIIKWSEKLAALPPEREQTLKRLIHRTPTEPAVQVFHILGRYLEANPNALANVGRTMFETDGLPEEWIPRCNAMDAIWVPSAFNRETFARAGVLPEKLRIVPGAIDLAPYNPDCAPLTIQGARGYNFLSLFDWTVRKGWDALLRAYIEEFRPDEDVALIVKTHSSIGYTLDHISAQIGRFVEQELGRDLNAIPDIVLQDTNVPEARMPNLYRAADCFVLPTRGEGWGRPFMEAMAMARCVIGTDWSGQTAFMNADNALLLDYELVPVPPAAVHEAPHFAGHRWAEPSVTHLRQLMRQAFEDRAGGKERGARARAHVEKHFTYRPVAALIAQELQRLVTSSRS